MADGIVETTDVGIQHPPHLAFVQGCGPCIERPMGRASRPETVGKTEEVIFIDGIQHLDDRALDDFVFQCRNAKWPLPTVRLRDVNPPRWQPSVFPFKHASVQALQSLVPLRVVFLPSQPIHSRSRLGIEPHEAASQP